MGRSGGTNGYVCVTLQIMCQVGSSVVQEDSEGDGECARRLAPGVLHSEARPEEVGSDIRFLCSGVTLEIPFHRMDS